jgi:DNA-binding CsgD family transcriptional regulator
MSVTRLSHREAEVAQLVREGLTNRDIAERLFISERTVEGHIQQIHNKLGFSSRAQIAAWVAEGMSPVVAVPATAARVPTAARRGRVPSRWLAAGAAAAIAAVAVAAFGVVEGLQSHQAGTPAAAAGQVKLLLAGTNYFGVVVAPDGTVYASTCPGVIKISPGGLPEAFVATYCSSFTGSGAPAEAQIAVGTDGRLYFLESQGGTAYSLKRATAEGTVTRIAGDPESENTADGVAALQARIVSPTSLAVDAEGNVFFSSFYEAKVKMISAETGLVSTVAGSGTKGDSGDGGAAVHAELGGVSHIALLGRVLYICDTNNARIRTVDPTGRIANVAGSGTPGYTGDGGPAERARLNQPRGLAFDSHGDLYVADSGNNVVRRVHAGKMSTVAGTGRPGSKLGSTALGTQLDSPTVLAFDQQDRLYVVDFYNRRILRFVLSPP